MPDEWSEQRQAVTYQEARTVLDHQNSTLSDIDTKAVQTVRLTTLLIGVGVTAIELDIVSEIHTIPLMLGGASLFLSLFFGMLTYSESDLYLGPNKEYTRQLATGQFHGTTWNDDLLLTMAYWIEENHKDIEWNGKLLTVTQALSLIGLFCVTVAVVF